MLPDGKSLRCLLITVFVIKLYMILLVVRGFLTQQLKQKQRNSFEIINPA